MKKIFDFIKSPKFFGMSCLAVASFLMGLLITNDIPLWVQILYIIVFWTLTGTGVNILSRLDFDKKLNFWIRQFYNEEIYRECDKGKKEFDITIPSKIAAANYVDYIGKNFPYFSGYMNDKHYTYVITDARINEDDVTYITMTFTKIKE